MLSGFRDVEVSAYSWEDDDYGLSRDGLSRLEEGFGMVENNLHLETLLPLKLTLTEQLALSIPLWQYSPKCLERKVESIPASSPSAHRRVAKEPSSLHLKIHYRLIDRKP